MKYYSLTILFLFCIARSSAQTMAGVEVGIGSATFFKLVPSRLENSYYNGTEVSGTAAPRLVIGLSYLRNDTTLRHFFWGGRLLLEQYSFDVTAQQGHGASENVQHKSTFLLLAPTLDIGAGKNRACHFFISADFGLRVSAAETTAGHAYYLPGRDTSYSSSGDVKSFILRPGVGLSQHARIHENWDLVFTEGANMMVSSLTTVAGATVHPGYIYFAVGVSRIPKRLPMLQKRARKPFIVSEAG